ncbi:MAG: argininosuccinate lyase [Dehalococcoidia bacterium]|jgi:argininosuccinate lyase|nr:argininosuccinate lyase [Dehalococcoidia bacterium]
MTSTPNGDPASYFASLAFDRRLAEYDVRGSVAWARALGAAGVLSTDEVEQVTKGLAQISGELEEGRFPFRPELEDIHFNVESRLTELIGPLGGKLHTGRSRNDQVALDVRLFVKDAIDGVIEGLAAYRRALVDQAAGHIGTLMPGYTHLQRAQPILLAHHLLAHEEAAVRDAARFRDALVRVDVMPLGSAALAGTAYPIDREALARDLGFAEGPSRNSIDAVSDRDFIVEFEAAAALAMVHLSRLAEEVVVWSSEEFGFVEVSTDYASGSSIMPQKRNPDAAELVRGKTGRVHGHLVAMLTTLKALPLAYNRDLQEDKEGLFDTVDTLHLSLGVTAGMVRGLTFRVGRMLDASTDGFLLATELADYLAKKGAPFREAHGAVRKLVDDAISAERTLSDLTIDDYQRVSPLFEPDVLEITVESAVEARGVPGGTSRNRVRGAVEEARTRLNLE